MSKVSVIGATGHVGQFVSYAISEIPFVDEIVLFGRKGNEDKLNGLIHDFRDAFAARGRSLSLIPSTDPRDLHGSDIIILTAGIPRKPGQDRMDLAYENGCLVKEYAELISLAAPDSIIFVVTNPVDVMTSVALRYSGFPKNRVFGLGTHLDSMRFKSYIAQFFNVHVSEVHTRIIGEHGESMVPLISATSIGGIDIQHLPTFEKLPVEEMIESVKTAGSAIIGEIGATIYGPGEAIATIVTTVLGNENRILTVSSYVKSEVHDIGDVCIGVPSRLNKEGSNPIPIQISEDEVKFFAESVSKIRSITADIFNQLDAESVKKD